METTVQDASLGDAPALPGPAKSWAPGEPIPADMPSADAPAGTSPGSQPAVDPASAAHVALGRVDEISRGLADIKRQEMDATGRVYGRMASDIDSGIAKAQQAAKDAGIEPGTLKPWNEAEESAKRQTDPIAAFGSLGSAFGILASAFTHAPMENALNASAAAINAINEGDAKAYDRAHKAWQDNTKLALDKHKIQHEQYQDAVELLKLNMAAGEAKMRVLASKFGDEKTLFLLENGMSKEVLDLQASREKLALDLAANRNKVALENFKMDTLLKDPRYKAPVGSPERQQLINEFQHEWGNKTKSTPAELFSNKWWAEHPEGTSEEYSAAMGGFLRGARSLSASGLETEAVVTRAKKIQEDATARGETLTFDQAYGQAYKEVRNEAGKPVYGATLEEDTLHTMAEQYLAGDKSVFQNLGRGVQGAANIVALREMVAKVAKERGIIGTELATRMAEFSGLMAGQRALGTRTANVEMFANETLNMIDVAADLSHNIPRTQFVPVNKALQAYQRNTGDPNIRAFGAAINSLVNTYAKAIAGGQQATVSDKDHAREILTSADTQEQFDAVLGVIRRELQAARQAPGQVKEEFRNLSGASSTIDKGRVPSAPRTIHYDAKGNRIAD